MRDRFLPGLIDRQDIGAIELPPRKDALIPFALTLMDEPFELTGKAANRIRRAIYQTFAGLV